MFVYHLFLPVFYVCMYVYILSYFVNKLEIWWLYLSPIEKNVFTTTCNLAGMNIEGSASKPRITIFDENDIFTEIKF